MLDLILIKKVNNKVYRVVTEKVYNKVNNKDEFYAAYIEVQIKRKFLFIPYWSTLKTYFCNKEKSVRLQEYNACKWFYKYIGDGKL